MKFYSSSLLFDYPWEKVSIGINRKYPNEHSTHVVAVDVLSREITGDGKLRTERLITCRQGAPKWAMKLLGAGENTLVREVMEVDVRNRTIVMNSHNLSLSNYLTVQETVSYSPCPKKPHACTVFKQDARITAYGAISKICEAIEEMSLERFRQNAQIGKKGFEMVLNGIFGNEV